MEKRELLLKAENMAKGRPEDIERAAEFCEDYKAFLDAAKTEREAVKEIMKRAFEEGYEEYSADKDYKAYDRACLSIRGKVAILVTFGKRALSEGVIFNIAHIDAPRLDLKPTPLYESEDISLFKTHYYGGIRKYQWTAIPLSMHGTVCLGDGSTKDICIGEEDNEPKLCISDLLPHLSRKQDERTLKEGVKAEELNIIVGSTPAKDEEKDAYKLRILEILYDKYKMTETDFIRAEIEIVPAMKACDIGLDRSLVGAYGQDDRVCAYTALRAAFCVTEPEHTTITVFTDKEEIGSYGTTGMDSKFLEHFLEDLCEKNGGRLRDLYRNSLCISSDVSAAYDPTFSDVFDKHNVSFINRGPVLKKYTGARGKAGASDASAETMGRVSLILDREDVVWQTGEMGKVDEGGGGTIAHFMAASDVDTVDLGVPVLSMHSPFELASKLDIYHTYRAYLAVLGS